MTFSTLTRTLHNKLKSAIQTIDRAKVARLLNDLYFNISEEEAESSIRKKREVKKP